uniref:CUB domain-containing protein n=1 Tax=Meloidogyne enterolobii TaxID=390850 RepID=A0A6V7WIM7_MELEN|nr:unnamed protein product [Meloidogyne enterolobii]
MPKIIYFIILFSIILKFTINKQLDEYDFGCIKLFVNPNSATLEEKMTLASNNQTKLRRIMVIRKNGYGFISSTGYPKDGYERVKCAVNLEAQEGSGLVINIKFLDLDLEPRYSRSDQCLRDYFILTFIDREGLEHTSERICGNKKPKSIQSMQAKLRVLFIATSPPLQHYLPNTNTSKRWKGFKLRFDFVKEEKISVINSQYEEPNKRYRSDCGGANLPNSLSGIIQSPGFPSTYPQNVNCFWLIRVDPNKRIYIRIMDLELSPTLDYERAFLSIIDGYSFGISSEEINQKINEDYQRSSNNILNFGSPRRDTTSISFYGNKSYYTEEGSLSYLSESNRVIIQFMTTDGPTQIQLAEYKKNYSPIGFRLLWTEVHSLIATSSDFPLTTDIENSVSQDAEENFDVITSDLCPGFVCLGGYFCLDSQNSVCVERNRLCINETLRCDGISNCAENDDSDEEYCYSKNPFSMSALAFLIIILIVLLLLISTCCIIKSFGNSKNERKIIKKLGNKENKEFPSTEVFNKEENGEMITERFKDNTKIQRNTEAIPSVSSIVNIQTNIIPATPPIIQEWNQQNNTWHNTKTTKNGIINNKQNLINENEQEILRLQPCLCPKPLEIICKQLNQNDFKSQKIKNKSEDNYAEEEGNKWVNESTSIWEQRKSFVAEMAEVNEDI